MIVFKINATNLMSLVIPQSTVVGVVITVFEMKVEKDNKDNITF